MASVFIAVALGGAWGLLCWWGDSLRSGVGALFNAGAPWLLLAFLAGAYARRVDLATVCGVLTLSSGVGAYYGAYHIARVVDPFADPRSFIPGGLAWLGIAVTAGVIFGIDGSSWIRGGTWRRSGAVALLAGATLAEGLFALNDYRTYRDLVLWLPALVEVVIGLAIPILLLARLREIVLGLGASLAFALAGLVAQPVLWEFLRVRFRV